MRDRWVAEIRDLWGKKDHPSLNDFPEVEVSEICLASLDAGIDVRVTVCTPPKPSTHAFVYLHGGGWIAPASGKHLGWAKRIAALSGQTVAAVHYRLAPEDRYPCALHDCVGVFLAMKKMFTGQVTVGGDSAGANLAAALWFFLPWPRDEPSRKVDAELWRVGPQSRETRLHETLGEGSSLQWP